jgi:nucleotide-binding universal stress UspA family protein
LAKTIFLGKENKHAIEIILLHIIQELPISRAFIDKPIRDQSGNYVSLSQKTMIIYDEMRKDMEKSLEEKKEMYKAIDGIKIISVILNGNPSNLVVDYADNNSVDLIVIGSNGLQGLSKVIKGLGSVSRNISEKVSCPILMVR